jgi:hypothetical protein
MLHTDSPSQVPQVHISKETLAKSLACLRDEWQGLEMRLQSVVVPLNRGPEPSMAGADVAKPMSPMANELNDAVRTVNEIASQIADIKRRLEI